MNHKTLLQS